MISRKKSLTFEVMIDRRKQVVKFNVLRYCLVWLTVIGQSDICSRVLYKLPKEHQKMMELDIEI